MACNVLYDMVHKVKEMADIIALFNLTKEKMCNHLIFYESICVGKGARETEVIENNQAADRYVR